MTSVYSTTIIRGIKKELQNQNNIELETLGSYISQSKRFLASLHKGSIKESVRMMMQDDEILSYIIHNMIKADLNWVPHSGNSLKTHRYKNCTWAIQSYLTHSEKVTKSKVKSLNYIFHKGDNQCLYDIIPNKQKSPEEELLKTEKSDKLSQLLKIDSIKERDRQIINDYYFNQMTLEQVGKKNKLTRERIRQILKDCIEKIQKSLTPQDIEYWTE